MFENVPNYPLSQVTLGCSNGQNSTHSTASETEADAIGFCTQFYPSRFDQCKHTIRSIRGSFIAWLQGIHDSFHVYQQLNPTQIGF